VKVHTNTHTHTHEHMQIRKHTHRMVRKHTHRMVYHHHKCTQRSSLQTCGIKSLVMIVTNRRSHPRHTCPPLLLVPVELCRSSPVSQACKHLSHAQSICVCARVHAHVAGAHVWVYGYVNICCVRSQLFRKHRRFTNTGMFRLSVCVRVYARTCTYVYNHYRYTNLDTTLTPFPHHGTSEGCGCRTVMTVIVIRVFKLQWVGDLCSP
jgi:hypothetical protein